MKQLGIKIKQLREQHWMSQEELAAQLEVAQTSVSKIESGKVVPNFLTMHHISQIFH